MLDVNFTEEEKCVIGACAQVIFSKSAISDVPVQYVLKEHGLFKNIITVGNELISLSDDCLECLHIIVKLLYNKQDVCTLITENEVRKIVIIVYKRFFSDHNGDCGNKFIAEVVDELFLLVSEFNYLVAMDGIELKDIEKLNFGKFCIQRPNKQLFDELKVDGALGTKSSYDMFGAAYWIIGTVKGSPEKSYTIFEQRVKIIIGILATYGCVLYKTSFSDSEIRAINPLARIPSTVNVLSWTNRQGSPSIYADYGVKSILQFNSDDIKYFKKECFYDYISIFINSSELSKLQISIFNSLYWMSDAYSEMNNVMSFVKLWTCVECFFSFDKKDRRGITEKIRSGLAVILAFSGYSIISAEEYEKFKNNVSKLYDKRCTALHGAEFDHVTIDDTNELAHFVAWLILSMVALSNRGYSSLNEVRDQVVRLDGIMSEH
jgi:hypothetical protein